MARQQRDLARDDAEFRAAGPARGFGLLRRGLDVGALRKAAAHVGGAAAKVDLDRLGGRVIENQHAFAAIDRRLGGDGNVDDGAARDPVHAGEGGAGVFGAHFGAHDVSPGFGGDLSG
jgi:hypothetical protein